MKYFTATILFFLPILVAQAQYTPIAGLPGVDQDADFNTYMNSLYALAIVIAALLAVIKITIAGAKWMMSDVVTNKEEAKKDIKGALLGLLVVLAAVLIISVINRDILNVSLTFTPAENTQTNTNNNGANGGGNNSGGNNNTNGQVTGVTVAACGGINGTVDASGQYCNNIPGLSVSDCAELGGTISINSGNCDFVSINNNTNTNQNNTNTTTYTPTDCSSAGGTIDGGFCMGIPGLTTDDCAEINGTISINSGQCDFIPLL